MKILELNLKKKWFDMILSGEKKEEYREIKPYWISRLMDKQTNFFRKFDAVRFKNGYSKDAPNFLIEFKDICIDYGYSGWGADIGETYFVIKLGNSIK